MFSILMAVTCINSKISVLVAILVLLDFNLARSLKGRLALRVGKGGRKSYGSCASGFLGQMIKRRACLRWKQVGRAIYCCS